MSALAPWCLYLLLTGEPGVGKTSVTKKLTALLREKGVKVYGFYTEETRRAGVREGFDVVSIDGAAVRGRLARETSLLEQQVKHYVGKYGVLVEEFEKIAVPILSETQGDRILVIDEIGKMEMFSQKFKSSLEAIFSPKLNNIVLATIPVSRTDPLVESIRNNSNSKIFEVRRDNRNTIHQEILKELESVLRLK